MIILSIIDSHNCTASLMKDGKIIAAVSEERFTRRKNEVGYPKQAIDYCLDFAGIKPDKIDCIAVSGNFIDLKWMSIERQARFSKEDYIFEQHEFFKKTIIEKKPPGEVYCDYLKKVEQRLGVDKNIYYDFSSVNKENYDDLELYRKIRIGALVKHLGVDQSIIKFFNHHKCHAYYAYYSSPFRDDSLIITADGWGEGLNATISTVKGGKIERIAESSLCNYARIYRYITLVLGMKPYEHEYKVMGLAPYANIKELEMAYKIFADIIEVDGLEFKWKNKPNDMYFHFRDNLEGCRFDGIAGAVQKMIEEGFTQWVRNAIKITGLNKVVFSGGLAMNIKLNLVIAKLPELDDLFVGPTPSDESTGIGASYIAMEEYCEENKIGKSVISSIDHVFLGPDFSKKDVIEAVNAVKGKYNVYENITNKDIAKYIAEGKTVGICRGRMEFGARSLGNRSIVANPSMYHILRKINSQIKFRDFWMPFTPSILKEKVDEYIENPKNISSPFMTIGFESTKKAHKELVSAIHPADLTVRPQMVTKETNKEYYDLIKEFEKLTGIGGILNTSLNLHGSPIVNKPIDAIEVMEKSKLDMMYFGDILLERKELMPNIKKT